MKTLLLKFAGPLQSWGTNSHFESRYTDFYPSKSAVIGIIAASFGYGRDEDIKIQQLNELDFALRIDQPGKLLRDFHIAQKLKDNGDFDKNYVTNRYYLEDAVFLVAISHNDETFMNKIAEALKNPYFQPFLGRRSLPPNYDFIVDIIDEEPVNILKNYSWQAAEWYQKKYKKEKIGLEIFADSNLLENSPKTLRKDRVISFSQKERKFAFRYES
ncbi:MAG: type I-E CRISPR-associated protein Cas5/CasD, partial [Christensenellaceae bacterium]|nr:type I-E CRISPR-associated protein Cas5/CasD [Christensenellaceae bacterium]